MHVIPFGEPATEVFLEWHDRVERGLPAGRAYHDVREFAVKIRDAVARIAGIFARLDESNVVTVDHVRRAIQLGEYHLAHAQAVVDSWAGKPMATAQKLLAKLRTRPEITPCDSCPDPSVGYVFHVRDATRWVRSATAETIVEALEVLDVHGHVRALDPNEGFGVPGRIPGKKSPHVIVNPAVFR